MKVHMDLDSFFISAERIKDPSLRGIPAAVGGRGDPFIFSKTEQKSEVIPKSKGAFSPSIFYDADKEFEEYFVEENRIRGIIITASYEARKMGVYTGMSVREALSLCPGIKVIPPNHLYYHTISANLKSFLAKELPVVEQFSIDEFFADLSGWVEEREVERFLKSLQHRIKTEFGLPISIGAAKSKWTAKLATSFAKPYGIRVVKDVESFLYNIPIERFPGIGRGYQKRLKRYHINYLHETKGAKSLFYSWKKPGIQLYNRIWGTDNEPVGAHTERKGIGISRTIDPILDREEIKRRFIILSRYLASSISRRQLNPSFYHIGVKYEFGGKSHAHTHIKRVFSETLLKRTALKLFHICDIYPDEKIVRLSLRCSRFLHKSSVEMLRYEEDRKLHRLLKESAKIREKWGMEKLKWGIEML